MIDRVRNAIKRDCKNLRINLTQNVERCKLWVCLCTDANSLEKHKKAIDTELGKAKPRESVLLPLMKSTYGERRMFILNEATSVAIILTIRERKPSMLGIF